MEKEIEAHLTEAEQKAWESLARYKFQMFGYWAAIWVHLNRIGKFGKPNPFKQLVLTARGGEPNPKRMEKAIEHAVDGLPNCLIRDELIDALEPEEKAA